MKIEKHTLCCSTVKQNLAHDLMDKREAFDIDVAAMQFEEHQNAHHYIDVDRFHPVKFLKQLSLETDGAEPHRNHI